MSFTSCAKLSALRGEQSECEKLLTDLTPDNQVLTEAAQGSLNPIQ